MGIREDVELIKDQIRASVDSSNAQALSRLIMQAFTLCKKLKEMLEEAGPLEKKQLAEMMTSLRDFIGSEGVRLSKKVGMSEEQLIQYNENPNNFSPEQWKAMQNIKNSFHAEAQEITKKMRQKIKKDSGEKPSLKKEGLGPSTRVRRGKWMKS